MTILDCSKQLDLEQILLKGNKIYSNENSHHNIDIKDYGNYRALIFDSTVFQTLIDINDPKAIPFILNQAMLASLLFIDKLKTICLVGMGGGGIARFFCAMDSQIKGDCIEINSEIINLAKTFFLKNKSTTNVEYQSNVFENNWSIFKTDANRFSYTKVYDLIIVDIAQGHVTPQWIVETNNLKKLHCALSDQGIVIFNIIYESKEKLVNMLYRIRQQFNQQILYFQVPGLNNILIYAFNFSIQEQKISTQLLDKKQNQWNIDFEYFYHKMKFISPR
jgi:spermidine synthase